MSDLWTRLESADKPIFLYGMGDGAQKLLAELNRRGIPVCGIFASDGFVRDKTFGGFRLQSYSQVKSRYNDIIVLLSFGTNLPSVIDNIKSVARGCELYAPDIPVYGNDFFDRAYYERCKPELDYVRSRLCDSRSVKVFDSITDFKLSGKIDHLFECESDADEDFDELLRPGGVFADLGAYRGDTVLQFLRHVGGFEHIYAIEPDEKSFKRLTENVGGSMVTCINAAAWDHSGTGKIETHGSRSTRVGCGTESTALLALDDMPGADSVTFIKMDVEGAEAQAIAGAAKTIVARKPALKIAAYHRSCDLFAIPLQVLALRDDYKVCLRHNPYIPAWDTDFYFV